MPLKESYLNGYWELEQFQYDFLKERLDGVYEKMGLVVQQQQQLLLPMFDDMKRSLSENDPNIHIVNAFSNELIPFVPDAGHNVGALGDAYFPRTFEAPSEGSDLMQFLNAGNKPICIGFGSMPYDSTKVKSLLQFLQGLE